MTPVSAGDEIIAENAAWTFGGDTARRMDQHLEKSVPLYHEGHDLVAKVADYFLSDGSLCYELGCSTAKLSSALAERKKRARFIGIDREQTMIDEASKRCKDLKNIDLVVSDIIDVEFEKSDLVIAYYTMQFIPPKSRQVVFKKIFEALNWGGALILFEKVRAPDARFQDLATGLYTDFKLDMGYTPDEIIAKSRSLKGVLEPFSTQGNLDLMARSGFKDIMSVMKFVCFEGFLAIK